MNAISARLRRWGPRLSWGVLDQGASALTNVAVNVQAARMLSPSDFGAFAVAYTSYLIILSLSRGAIYEPAITSRLNQPDPELEDWSAEVGALLAISVPTSALLLVGGLLAPSVRSPLLALAAVLPLLLLQDTLRMILIGRRMERDAFIGDAFWLVGCIALLALAGRTFAWVLLTAWALASLSAVVYYWRAGGFSCSLRRGMGWLSREWRTSVPWVSEYAVVAIAGQGITLVLAARAGLADAGAFRGALTLLGPMNVFLAGIRLVLLPAVLRRTESSPTRDAAWTASALALFGAIIGLPLLLIPGALGTALLGGSWAGARQVLAWLILQRVATGASVGPFLAHRRLRSRRAPLVVRVITGIVAVGGAALVAPLGGARVVAPVVAAAAVGSLALWFVSLRFVSQKASSGGQAVG